MTNPTAEAIAQQVSDVTRRLNAIDRDRNSLADQAICDAGNLIHQLHASRAEQAGGDDLPCWRCREGDDANPQPGPCKCAQHPQRPEGVEWVLVPSKMTNKMQVAGLTALDESDATPDSIGNLIGYKAVREAYVAMIAAAPAPPAVGEGMSLQAIHDDMVKTIDEHPDYGSLMMYLGSWQFRIGQILAGAINAGDTDNLLCLSVARRLAELLDEADGSQRFKDCAAAFLGAHGTLILDRLSATPTQPPVQDARDGDYEVRTDGARVRKDRWEIGFRNIVTAVSGPRTEFEIDEIVDRVRQLAQRPQQADGGTVALFDAIVAKSWTVELEDGGIANAVYIKDVREAFEANPPKSPVVSDVTDEMVERLANYIYRNESVNCKTLDEAVFHQSNWRRAIPEARQMLLAAIGEVKS